MRIHSDNAGDVSPADLRDKALNLRESVNSSRARMSAQKERLERLRRDIAELRALAGRPLPAPAPVSKEAAPVSAAGATSFKTGSRSWRPAPYVAIFFAAAGLQVHASYPRVSPSAALALPPIPAAAAIESPAPIPDDGGSDEALMLAHDWRMSGDERTIADRLGAGMNPPGSKPEWTSERTGERTYRVTFMPNGADFGYDFDVDLSSRRVDPTPETAELISPRLVSRR